MDVLKEIVASMNAELKEIEGELQLAEEKGAFVYRRSRAIRKSSLEIIKLAKELRKETQEYYLTQQES